MVFYPITRQMPERKKLNECPAADAGTVSKIISSFGRLKNFLILFDLILM